jgi:hypothetical protein
VGVEASDLFSFVTILCFKVRGVIVDLCFIQNGPYRGQRSSSFVITVFLPITGYRSSVSVGKLSFIGVGEVPVCLWRLASSPLKDVSC